MDRITLIVVAIMFPFFANAQVGYTVTAPQTHFYNKPEEGSAQRKAYLVKGERIVSLKEQDGFIYTEFKNKEGVTTKGWLILVDLMDDSTINSYKGVKYVYQRTEKAEAAGKTQGQPLKTTNSVVHPKKEKTLPSPVLKEFARCASYQYKYGSNNFKAFIYQSFGTKQLPELAVMMENLYQNPKDEYAVIDAFWRLSGNDRNYLFVNLSSIGLTANTAKIITDYLIDKHTTQE